MRKLTAQQCEEIRLAWNTRPRNITLAELARNYGLCLSWTAKVARGRQSKSKSTARLSIEQEAFKRLDAVPNSSIHSVERLSVLADTSINYVRKWRKLQKLQQKNEAIQ